MILFLGVLGETGAQQRREQQRQRSGSQHIPMQEVSLELPGSEDIISMHAEVPREMRVGDTFTCSVRIANVSENVAIHNLKLNVRPQEGLTIETVKLQASQDSSKQQRSQSPGSTSEQPSSRQQTSQQQEQEADSGRSTARQQNGQQNQRDAQQQRPEQQEEQQTGQQQSRRGQQQQSDISERPASQTNQSSNQSSNQNQTDQQQRARDESQSQEGERESQQGQSGTQREMTGSSQAADGSHEITIAQLRPGESRTIEITATAEKEGQRQACVAVTSFSPAFCLTTKAVKPELELVKQAPEKAQLCEPIEFEYFVKNTGSGDLQAFDITDKLPQGLQTQSGDDQLQFTVDGLTAGEVRKFVATLTATESGTYSSRAVAETRDGQTTRSSKTTTKVEQAQLAVAIDGPHVVMVDQPFTYRIRVTNQGNIPAADAKLRLSYPQAARLTAIGDVRETDQQVEQEAGVTQPTQAGKSATESQQRSPQQRSQGGQGQQSGRQQPDQQEQQQQQSDRPQQQGQQQRQQSAPREQSTAAGQGRSGQQQQQSPEQHETREWDLGTLQPGQTRLVTVTLTADTSAEQLRSTAIAEYRCATQDADRLESKAFVSTEAISVPALLLTVIDNEDQRDPSGRVRYTIVVHNQGTAPDQNLQLNAQLPGDLEFVEGTGETEVTADGGRLSIQSLDELKPGERAYWEIVARSKIEEGPKQVQFRVDLSSNSLRNRVSAEEPTTLLPPAERTSTN